MMCGISQYAALNWSDYYYAAILQYHFRILQQMADKGMLQVNCPIIVCCSSSPGYGLIKYVCITA